MYVLEEVGVEYCSAVCGYSWLDLEVEKGPKDPLLPRVPMPVLLADVGVGGNPASPALSLCEELLRCNEASGGPGDGS